MQKTKNKSVAVLISDVHYNLSTLETADKAVRLAISKANDLCVPLIVCGDLHDTKANIRGECIKAMLDTFSTCNYTPIIIRGNHDSINEKSTEHSLEFLSHIARIASVAKRPSEWLLSGWTLIPYFHDNNELRQYLSTLAPNSKIIMHQGVLGSASGEYFHDRSALSKEDLAGHRVISGHYHERQTISIPVGGMLDYLGNPYTLNFGETSHPPKGMHILYENGDLEFVDLGLRRHRIVELDGIDDQPNIKVNDNDIIMVKLKDTAANLKLITKTSIAEKLNIKNDYRLDLITTDQKVVKTENHAKLDNKDLLDSMIESLSSTDSETKGRVKDLWKLLIAEE